MRLTNLQENYPCHPEQEYLGRAASNSESSGFILFDPFTFPQFLISRLLQPHLIHIDLPSCKLCRL